MADPLSVTASVLAVATAAVSSIRSLCDTVKRFQNRNKTLGRLHDKLHDLATIIDGLIQVINTDASVLVLLKGPVERCKEICNEFEQSMKKFDGKSRTGLLDWTKLEFMKGDINDFIDTIEGYKSTITVGIGTLNLRNSKISSQVLQQYEEMIKDTAYNLEVHLQQIDEKLTQSQGQGIDEPVTSINLQDERAVTQQCLRVCKDASSYIEGLATRESSLLRPTSPTHAGDEHGEDFEARVLTRQAFNASQATLLSVINSLGERLNSVILNRGSDNATERSRLQEDLNVSKQCLQVCKVASEISQQKIHSIGEALAEDNSDQVVVTTLADLFDVKRAVSRGHSAQLVATLTPDNFDTVVERRYSSRFAALPDHSSRSQIDSTTSPTISTSQTNEQAASSGTGKDVPSSGPETKRDRPNSNEMRKRFTNGNNQQTATRHKE